MPLNRRMPSARTMFDKIWDRHVVATAESGMTLLYIDRCFIHEGSRHAFQMLKERGLPAARPEQVIACSDHYVPTRHRARGLAAISDDKIRGMVELLEQNTHEHGIRLFGMGDGAQGILHVVGPEQGITQPGLVIVGGDSHTSTHGALGNLSFGIGASEVFHTIATQTLWQRRPKTRCIRIDGRLGFGVSAKDIILAIIGRIGIGGAAGHVIEYVGSTITALSMEQRMTICNMSIEAGARAGMIACDDTTFSYLKGRPFAPTGAMWDEALTFWQSLPSDPDAQFDRTFALDATEVTPMVTWGTNPEHVLPITSAVPDPAAEAADRRAEIESALDYMAIKPGTRLTDIAVDRVFIGSCTNARIEDLRAAADVARLGHTQVPAIVVPGSTPVKRQAESEGLDRVFMAAGFEWHDAGCSLCTALNGDALAPGERCASTSNRNFRGRQGPGGRTHLMSPAMAAAAALTGKLTDVRTLMRRD
jgi:3-isopropylmalate/(R)-2-methylmalate dehydratase large subunit